MQFPVNLASMPLAPFSLAEGLAAPEKHLSHFGDPSYLFAHLALSGEELVQSKAAAFLLLRKGALVIESAGSRVTLDAGQVALLGAGTEATIRSEGEAEIVLILHLTAPLAAGVTRLDLDAPLSPSGSPSAEVLTSPAPECASAEIKGAAPLSLGLWSATPYSRINVTMAYSEVMYFLEGAVIFTHADGSRHAFAGGDVVLCPIGAPLAWESTAKVRKLWITAEAKG